MTTLDVELRMIIDYALSIDKREMNESELCSEIEICGIGKRITEIDQWIERQ